MPLCGDDVASPPEEETKEEINWADIMAGKERNEVMHCHDIVSAFAVCGLDGCQPVPGDRRRGIPIEVNGPIDLQWETAAPPLGRHLRVFEGNGSKPPDPPLK
ncbi:hypothetical protein FKM82_025807 [Ascaphus truei]